QHIKQASCSKYGIHARPLNLSQDRDALSSVLFDENGYLRLGEETTGLQLFCNHDLSLIGSKPSHVLRSYKAQRDGSIIRHSHFVVIFWRAEYTDLDQIARADH